MGLLTLFRLSSKDDEKRKQGIREVAAARNPGSDKLFVDIIFKDSSREVRDEAANGLRQLNSEAAFEFLAAVVQADSGDARNRAVDALGKIGAAAFPFVLPLAESNDPKLRYAAIRVLAESGDPAIAPILGREIGVLVGDYWESTTQWRYDAAIRGLKTIGGEAAVRALVPHLNRDDAYAALKEIDPDWLQTGAAREEVEKMVAGLGERAMSPRLAEVLSRISDRSYIPALLRSVEVENVIPTLEKLDPQWRERPEVAGKTEELVARLATESAKARRGWLIAALAGIGGRRALDGLIDWLPKEPEEDLREKVVTALAAVGGRRILDALIDWLPHEPNCFLRRRLVGVLNDVGGRSILEPMVSIYLTMDSFTVGEAGEVLDSLDPHWRGPIADKIARQFGGNASSRPMIWADFNGAAAHVSAREFSPPFAELAQASDRHLRAWALCVLSKVDWEAARDRVHDLLLRPQAFERQLAAKLIQRFAPRGDELAARGTVETRNWQPSEYSIFCFSCGKALHINLSEPSQAEKDFFGGAGEALASRGLGDGWCCCACWDMLCGSCAGVEPQACGRCGSRLIQAPGRETVAQFIHGLPIAALA